MEISQIISIPEGGETKIGTDCIVTRRKVSKPEFGDNPASFVETSMITTSQLASSIMKDERLGLLILSVDKGGNAFMFKFKTPPSKEESKSIEDTVTSLCPILLSVAADIDRYGIVDRDTLMARFAASASGHPGKHGKTVLFVGGSRKHRIAVRQMWCNSCKQAHSIGEHRMFEPNETGEFDNPASMLDAMFPAITG